MAKQKEEKTNVMRVLEQKKIPYTAHTYDHEEGVAVDGVTVAQATGRDPETVFKTLVARGASKGIYVFVIPVAENLDLKKAAKAVGEKSIEMVHVKEINALTGYIRGGCSPVGMKKQYPTVFHETVEILDTIMVSAGKIGYQVELEPSALVNLVGASTADITVEQTGG
jgi:Cys-tRNA(Pro)/Cys-tRNA(Cys) deacylase